MSLAPATFRLPRFVPTLIFCVLTLILFGDALFSSAALVIGKSGSDLTLQFLPWRDFAWRNMRASEFPLWNPHIFLGQPFFAGFQSALLYPPNFFAFDPSVESGD